MLGGALLEHGRCNDFTLRPAFPPNAEPLPRDDPVMVPAPDPLKKRRLSLHLAATLVLAPVAHHAVARDIEPLLPPDAFRPVTACSSIDPFADRRPDEAHRRLDADCNPDAPWRLVVRTPRVRPTDTGPSRVEVDVDRQVGVHTGFFTGVARLGVAAASDGVEPRLQPRRTLLAAHGTVRLGEQLSLDLGIGHDAFPAPRRRATATATYRIPGRHLLFLQVADEPDSEPVPSLGLRWWLIPGRTSLDLSARRTPDGEIVEPRIGLRWSGP